MTNDFKPAKAGGNQPRLSKEEYAEKKRAEKEKVYQMIDDAAREIVSDPEKFKSFLDTQSRMDRYSAANALLIYSQYPQAAKCFLMLSYPITPTIILPLFYTVEPCIPCNDVF